jgi:hypothetical protein
MPTSARVAPAILELLADVVAALAGQHAADDVELASIRLAVTEQVKEVGGRYTLPPPEGP